MSGGQGLRRLAWIVALSLAFATGCARPHFPGWIITPSAPEPAPEATGRIPLPSDDPWERCSRITALEVRKAERSLLVRCDDGSEIQLQAALGREPRGPKVRQGDMRTPEGTYRIAGPPRESRFHLFLPIDYPSESDARRGHAEGLISEGELRAIVAAWSELRLPPQHTALGGHLGLHGEGPRWQGDSKGLDWTMGCVALSDADIERVARRVGPGTPVTILP